ncbi:hypothetical protein CKQ80_09705 [Pseudomonas moraviensis]|uniref:Uncharacterized protein n=1 Tax=Pseudomonas moraviensis TaxID=321662 RepID=A0A2A2PJD8_9PSED|nr:hypothetical protein [Pseudomonas moraviensis]PAW51060.1 hypothetical protein CKQ68_27540 [Pseudomonas moraviensis]PAW55570.1 hypothetical protein CKQ80_09705 [Pseudomonas moraviensis]
MATQSVIEIYDRVEEFQALLAAAELHASGAWELEFTENLRANFKRYGAHTNLSPAQQSKLERIAKA